MPIVKLITSYGGCSFADDVRVIADGDYTYVSTTPCDCVTALANLAVSSHFVNNCDSDVDINYYFEYYEYLSGTYTLYGTTPVVYRTIAPGDNIINDTGDPPYWGCWGQGSLNTNRFINVIIYITYPDLSTLVQSYIELYPSEPCYPYCFLTSSCG